MAGWVSRTLSWFAAAPARPVARRLLPSELQAALASSQQKLAQGGTAEAREILRDIVASNPDSAEAFATYGLAAYLCGDAVDARGALLRAVEIDPNHLTGQKYLAAACNALGDWHQLEIAAGNALRLSPRDVDTLNMQGIARMNALQTDAAAELFNAAVEAAPNDITALLNLELLSIRAYRDRRTLEHSPRVAAARLQAINHLRAQYRRHLLDDAGLAKLLLLLSGARDTFPLALKLASTAAEREDFDPALADQLAGIFGTAGDLQNSLRFRRIVAELSNLPRAKSNLARTQLFESYDQWRGCWRTLQSEEHYFNPTLYADEVAAWTGQRVGKKKILVYQDQGIGDTILALRLVPMLAKRGVRFDLWVRPVLAGLARGVNGYENLLPGDARPDARSQGCEYASTLFGLIAALDADPKELAAAPTLLTPASDRALAVREHLRTLPGRRVGLAYGGNPSRRDDWFRSIPPSALAPLARIPGISWVNLVSDERPDRAEVIEMFRMHDPMPQAADFEDTAAIISELDIVIAIDSSVAHLACSLSKPVWVLVPPMRDWRWQIGTDTHPWWPTATVLRASAPGEWVGVIEELAKRMGSGSG